MLVQIQKFLFILCLSSYLNKCTYSDLFLNLFNINIRSFGVLKQIMRIAVIIAIIVYEANPAIPMYNHFFFKLPFFLLKKL
jgi:hypothetical protein